VGRSTTVGVTFRVCQSLGTQASLTFRPFTTPTSVPLALRCIKVGGIQLALTTIPFTVIVGASWVGRSTTVGVTFRVCQSLGTQASLTFKPFTRPTSVPLALRWSSCMRSRASLASMYTGRSGAATQIAPSRFRPTTFPSLSTTSWPPRQLRSSGHSW